MQDLEQWGDEMPENVLRRCRHVVTENLRTVAAADALEAGNLKKLGNLMAAAHASYRDDFEASCEEADIMVAAANRLPGLIGARLTGGGFGGCTVNLVESGEGGRNLPAGWARIIGRQRGSTRRFTAATLRLPPMPLRRTEIMTI